MLTYFYAKDFRNLKEVEIYPSEFINLISGNNGEGIFYIKDVSK